MSSHQASGWPRANTFTKIIVQNMPYEVLKDYDYGYFSILNDYDVTNFFSEYGPCQCSYLRDNLTFTDKLGENFVEVTFEQQRHAVTVWKIANTEGLIYETHQLIVTLVSENSSPISTLADDCLHHMISMLNVQDKLKIHQVSKRWKHLAAEYWARQKYLDFEKETGSTSDLCKALMKVGMHLKGLSLSTTSMQYLVTIGKYCQNIGNMKLIVTYEEDDVDVFFDNFAAMFTSLKNLLVLQLENLKPGFRFDFVQNLPKQMRHLVVEDNGNPRITLCIELSKLNPWNKRQLGNWTVGPKGLRRIEKWFVNQNGEDVVTITSNGVSLPLSKFHGEMF